MTHILPSSVAIIGGGPAGLMAADVLSQAGVRVSVYDAMPSVGRKFLLAGVGGMNISNVEPFEQFVLRYGTRSHRCAAMLQQFSPDALRAWLDELGIKTFVGSSGRVFPTDMKAAPLLRAWLHRLRGAGVKLQVRHRWLGWSATASGALSFATPEGLKHVQADAVVLALGGGSWGKFGATGAWVPILAERGIAVAPLLPSNCGFDGVWSDLFKTRFAGRPLKSVAAMVIKADGSRVQQHGELMVTATGLEGGLIYAFSAPLREAVMATGSATVYVDLMPQLDAQTVIKKLSPPRLKQSLSNYLRKHLGLEGVKAGLLREILTTADFEDKARLAGFIKALPIKLVATRPLDEAISSAGGVRFEALDKHLMLHEHPGIFCAGEMLDWEAPTGGYLLTACFASGYVAGQGVLQWLHKR